MSGKKTAIITGASGGIGAGLVEGFLREGYNVVGTSREGNRKLISSGSLVLIDGDIGNQQTAAYAVEAAINNFGTVDVLLRHSLSNWLVNSGTDAKRCRRCFDTRSRKRRLTCILKVTMTTKSVHRENFVD